MAAPKLTPTQREVLALVAAGKVWRSESSRSLYQWFADGRRGSVGATVKVLLRLGLISIDFSDRMRPVAILTDAGRALLDGQPDAVKPTGGEN